MLKGSSLTLPLLALLPLARARCPNAVEPLEVKRAFERLAARDFVGQQQSWAYVSPILESYTGLAPRATCADWTLHFTGPSGSGKSFLAELIANAAFQPWEEEPYSMAQMGITGGGGAAGGTLGWFLGGPVGVALGSSAGAYGAKRAWEAALDYVPSLGSTFRAPKPFPSQCGVVQHKFSRGSTVEEVAQWEYRVAAELQRDPTSVIVVDDVGRLKDAEAFEHFGRLLCGVGGNSVPEFRTGPTDPTLVAANQALFVLTSDLEVDPMETQISCEIDAWEGMLDAVRRQSMRFWSDRNMHVPDWWQQMPLVPFRELCSDELSDVARSYLTRQAELAVQTIEAGLERRSSYAIGAQRALRWTGTVKHGTQSFAALDAYVIDSVGSAKLSGGRLGGWVVTDFQKSVMRPAMQELSSGERVLVMGGGHHKETSWYNYTTLTYTSEVCLVVTSRDEPGALPRVTFSLMKHYCP
jgi:hypothetical protein